MSEKGGGGPCRPPPLYAYGRVVMGQKSTYYVETFCYTFAKGHVYGKDTASIGFWPKI